MNKNCSLVDRWYTKTLALEIKLFLPSLFVPMSSSSIFLIISLIFILLLPFKGKYKGILLSVSTKTGNYFMLISALRSVCRFPFAFGFVVLFVFFLFVKTFHEKYVNYAANFSWGTTILHNYKHHIWSRLLQYYTNLS